MKNDREALDYQTYEPHVDLRSLVICYWTLKGPKQTEPQKQRVVPDGSIEMGFILGDNIKRYTSENEFILQPRALVLGHTIEPFYVEATGYVNSLAVKFYPYGFANFISEPINNLINKETPTEQLLGKETTAYLVQEITKAENTAQRIAVIEKFLLNKLSEQKMINKIVKSTVDYLLATNGDTSISTIFKNEPSKRRQLERNFKKQVGISPKQLGKVLRFQAALKMLLNQQSETFTDIAYKNGYFDQAHFIKDFKEFTGITPKEFFAHNSATLTAIIYK